MYEERKIISDCFRHVASQGIHLSEVGIGYLRFNLTISFSESNGPARG